MAHRDGTCEICDRQQKAFEAMQEALRKAIMPLEHYVLDLPRTVTYDAGKDALTEARAALALAKGVNQGYMADANARLIAAAPSAVDDAMNSKARDRAIACLPELIEAAHRARMLLSGWRFDLNQANDDRVLRVGEAEDNLRRILARIEGE